MDRTHPRLVNVAQVRHLSPFRYPGGKTWLVPTVREWLSQMSPDDRRLLLEPFAGGATVGLTAATEHLVERVELVELDENVAAVWNLVFNGTPEDVHRLCDRICTFDVSLDAVRETIDAEPSTTFERAFRTIVKNRCQRGGVMARGAGLVRAGENGRGLLSRWYPETLAKRFVALLELKPFVGFTHGDAFAAIERFGDATVFADPPYTAGGKRAGSRLYDYSELNHELLFKVLAANQSPALLTYDDTGVVRQMAAVYGFNCTNIPMKNSHHVVMRELAIFKPATRPAPVNRKV